MTRSKKTRAVCFLWYLLLTITLTISSLGDIKAANETPLQNARVETSGNELVSKVAPGDFLPIAVKLLNFGSGKKVDVMITYNILNSSQKIVASTTETVAVETTASFIKNIQIPEDSPPGNYTARANIIYQDQVVPAITEFSFTVESKLFGFFRGEFISTAAITVLMSAIISLLIHFGIKKYRISRLNPLDYGNMPPGERVFYELLSDTILSMRLKVGDIALEIASGVEGLSIDKKTGKVLKFTQRPSQVIASLVAEYEKVLNQKVSFSFRKNK